MAMPVMANSTTSIQPIAKQPRKKKAMIVFWLSDVVQAHAIGNPSD
jgi:hypothetical protein